MDSLSPDSPNGEFYREEPRPARPRGRPPGAKTLKEQLADSVAIKALKKKPSLIISEEEAEEKAEALKAALEDHFETLDSYLWRRQKLFTPDDADDREIWSNMTDREIEKLVRLSIRLGKRYPAMATVVNGTIEGADYLAAAAILMPRLRDTGRIMRDTHRPAKKRGQK